jgi:hypothetical protein
MELSRVRRPASHLLPGEPSAGSPITSPVPSEVFNYLLEHEIYILAAHRYSIRTDFEGCGRKISNDMPIANVSWTFQNESHNLIGDHQGGR